VNFCHSYVQWTKLATCHLLEYVIRWHIIYDHVCRVETAVWVMKTASVILPDILPSVLWRCSLGSRKGILPVKTWWGTGVVICLEWGANDLHMVQLMPLPCHHLLLQYNPKWLTLLVSAYPAQVVLEKRLLNACSNSSSFSFATYWPIFKSLLLADSVVNLQ